jgi:hypothetical protein
MKGGAVQVVGRDSDGIVRTTVPDAQPRPSSLARWPARGLLVVLLLPLLVVFSDPRPARALVFAPLVPVVAPTVARTVVIPAAKYACGPSCRGALFAGAVAAAQAVCGWLSDACEFPWGQTEGVTPDSDVQRLGTDPCGGDGQFVITPGSPTNVDAPNRWMFSFSKCEKPMMVRYVSSLGANGALMRSPSSSGTGSGYMTTDVVGGGVWPDLGTWAQNAPLEQIGPPVWSWGTWADYTSPERKGQPYKRCSNEAGSSRWVAGSAFSYREAKPRTPVELPACPAEFPIPGGGGISAGNPWATPGVQPLSAPGPSPLTPVVAPGPDPELWPEAPRTPEQPRRTQPGTTGVPLPNADPLTGAPLVDPVSRPAPVPDEGPCMWGGYEVPAADCDGAPAPEAAPTAPPTTAPTSGPTSPPTPAPSGFPAPTPEPVPADAQGCMGEGVTLNPVTWVYTPVKCALRWAFVPSPDAVDGVQASAEDLMNNHPPFTYLTAGTAWIGGVTNGGTECFSLRVSTMQGPVRVVDTCDRRAPEQWLANNRTWIGAALWASFLLPIMWWAWRQYAPGSTGVA